ncbi:MAG TPA: M48 family metallopeptidase [Bauldia sp.]|nr:M48 family metallopeptidase [Bauldia sp.]
MLGSYGLRTYIWNNRLKSLALLAGFPFLLFLICFAFALVISAFDNPDVGEGIANAIALTPSLVPVALGGALIWFIIAWFANTGIVALATSAKSVDRKTEPRLWNILENLCISRGITMPKLRVIETDARNAFATGVRKNQYSVTVTRGLMDTLSDQELEAVLAHELTHIENRDVQLLVIAAVFVGIISLVGDLLVRSPRVLLFGNRSGSGSSGGGFSSGGSRRSSSRSSGNSKGGGGAIILILIAVAIFLIARLLAIALRMAMSRKREFLADAGSVELTKDPDAMISALRKIAGHSDLQAPSQIQEMFLDHPREKGFARFFATHPSIDDRVAALAKFAGGHDLGPAEPQAASSASAEAPAPSPAIDPAGPDAAPHPWGLPPQQ